LISYGIVPKDDVTIVPIKYALAISKQKSDKIFAKLSTRLSILKTDLVLNSFTVFTGG